MLADAFPVLDSHGQKGYDEDASYERSFCRRCKRADGGVQVQKHWPTTITDVEKRTTQHSTAQGEWFEKTQGKNKNRHLSATQRVWQPDCAFTAKPLYIYETDGVLCEKKLKRASLQTVILARILRSCCCYSNDSERAFLFLVIFC